jgi:hypothetical protein
MEETIGKAAPERPALPWRLAGMARTVLSNVVYLYRTSAPWSIFLGYALTLAKRFHIKRKYRARESAFRAAMAAGRFSTDWFSVKIPFWIHAFGVLDAPATSLDVLEIGSWEGMSTCFILKTLPNAHVTCVDTWAGSDEHVGMEDQVNRTEANFDFNTADYGDRLTKRKQSSADFFASCPEQSQFDFIHIDGSHHARDVMIDVTSGFAHLRVGGLMILDDYLWRDYGRLSDNPAVAINAFLKTNAGKYALVLVNYQVFLRKTAA